MSSRLTTCELLHNATTNDDDLVTWLKLRNPGNPQSDAARNVCRHLLTRACEYGRRGLATRLGCCTNQGHLPMVPETISSQTRPELVQTPFIVTHCPIERHSPFRFLTDSPMRRNDNEPSLLVSLRIADGLCERARPRFEAHMDTRIVGARLDTEYISMSRRAARFLANQDGLLLSCNATSPSQREGAPLPHL